MKRNIVETLIGAVVLVVAGGFFLFAYSRADVGAAAGYPVHAEFSAVGGLTEGADVRISGIKVGTVSRLALNPETFLARVTMTIQDDVELTSDTAALISIEGLLGGAYVSLEPGGELDTIPPDGNILFAQAAPDIISLMSQLVFSSAGGPGQ